MAYRSRRVVLKTSKTNYHFWFYVAVDNDPRTSLIDEDVLPRSGSERMIELPDRNQSRTTAAPAGQETDVAVQAVALPKSKLPNLNSPI